MWYSPLCQPVFYCATKCYAARSCSSHTCFLALPGHTPCVVEKHVWFALDTELQGSVKLLL